MKTIAQTEKNHIVLLIENSKSNGIVQEMLPQTYSLQRATSLVAAYESVSLYGVKVIVLDLSLTVGSELETFVAMKSFAPKTPILVLASPENEDLAVQAVNLGAHDYILRNCLTKHTLCQSIRNATVSKQAEEAASNIIARKRSELLLFAQNGVTRILSESDTLGDAVPRILQLLAETLDWEVAEFWSMDKEQNVLGCVDLWHKEDSKLEEFEAISRHITFSFGIGLPGLVWSKGEPIWIEDVRSECSSPRANVLKTAGLHTGVGFPILNEGEVLGTVSLFTSDVRGLDLEMQKMLASVSAQFGQFMGRKAAQQTALEATKAEHRIAKAILENAPIGIARLNTNLEITEANYVFSQQFKVPLSNLPGKFLLEIATGIPNEELLAVVQKGIPFNHDNFRISFDDSVPYSAGFFDLMIWPVKNDANQSISVIVLTVDVNERVKLAKQRDDFVATLTHDLKNPLIGQERMLGLILKGAVGPIREEQRDMLALLKIGTQELLELIGTLLEVYRYEQGAPRLRIERLDVKALINGCIAQLTPIADGKGVTMESAIPDKLPPFSGDKMALRRVLTNLLDNAVKFTPTGGFIHVSCRCKNTDLCITVEDNGIGISDKELRLLFQRFVQAGSGRTTAGTGLGLYLCRQIVEAHGGKITCVSQQGAGTSILVTLPNSDVDASAASNLS